MAAQSIPLSSLPPRPPSASGNSTRDATGPLLDFKFIDTQYSNQDGKNDPPGYGEKPWLYMDGLVYKGDVSNAYLSIRLDKRDDFLEHLRDEAKRKMVVKEVNRIKTTRARFEADENKKTMLKELGKARSEWMQGVFGDLEARRQCVEKYEKQERRDRYFALLKRIEDQPQIWSKGGAAAAESLRQEAPGDAATVESPRQESPGDAAAVESPRQEAPGAPGGSVHDPERLASDCGFEAGVMYFKRSLGSDGGGWEGCRSDHAWFSGKEFPNQKIPTHKLLEEHEGNPLTERENECLRWFHFPANHMGWIEQAVARYYGEKDVVRDEHVKPLSKMTQAERLLRRELWHGQLHGSGDKTPIHARHMRSKFFQTPRGSSTAAKIPTRGKVGNEARPYPSNHATPGTGQKAMKNVGLFIPYLHWETNSARAKMVEAIDKADNVPKAREKKPNKKTATDLANVAKAINTANESKPRRLFKCSKKEALPAEDHKPSKLGKYLMQLAQVADAMDREMDEKLLKENLYKDPPLHIRRTLDQYHFLTLEDTSERDRDQVVYRETRERRKRKKGRGTEVAHLGQSTRIVMVDQLWLWILDDDTIITSFPRRWGRNKPDPSGVHKSLRVRLANNSSISSIYHLALIIVDQCSGVFFDRTKPLDRRPEVIDLFGSAIGRVTELTAIAYDTFWRNTSLHSRNMLPGPAPSPSQYRESKNTSQRYLDINPEGLLLREGRDIAEELKIMHRVFYQQRQAVKDFRRYLNQLEGKGGKGGAKATVQSLVRDLTDMVRKEADDMRYRDTSSQTPPLPSTAVTASSSAGGSPTSALHNGPTRSGDGSDSPGSWLEDTLQEADMLLESIESRQDEIKDLEDSALRTCGQLEGLLSLKQQQASIVEAKAALDRASESVKQGRSIMAFTIVTIFFLPLGFFAGVFGMNNELSTGNQWMTLGDQIKYMVGLSSVITVVAISIAFSSWVRALLTRLVRVPLLLLAQDKRLRNLWSKLVAGEAESSERKNELPDKVPRRGADGEARGQDGCTATSVKPAAAGQNHENTTGAEPVSGLNGGSDATALQTTSDANAGDDGGRERSSFPAGWFPPRLRSRKGEAGNSNV